jgi:phospholipid/cholesterol/gamma-HCH transport system permease protein
MPTDSPKPDEAQEAQGAQPRVDEREQAGGRWAVASGRWTVLAMSSMPAWTTLSDSLKGVPAQQGQAWDLRPIEQLDHIGAQLLWNHWGQAWPARLEMDSQHKAVLDQVALYTCSAPVEPGVTLAERFRHFAHNGSRMMFVARDFLALIGQLVLDVGKLLRAPLRGPWRDFSGQIYQFGTTALPITALVGLLIGVVLAYLTSQQLRQYGAEAITAQIGVMRVTEELDAMRVMGIPHGFRLVMPRVLALAITMPLISMWTSMAALLGGMIAADLALDISPAYFLSALPRAVPMSNLYLALSKSAVFGILIALIGCHFGMKVKPNTESLGRGTTSSVVTSITVVILVDALFAVLFKGVGLR